MDFEGGCGSVQGKKLRRARLDIIEALSCHHLMLGGHRLCHHGQEMLRLNHREGIQEEIEGASDISQVV